ncbi:MAG: TonB-dependent receptor [Psychromonas sp.]
MLRQNYTPIALILSTLFSTQSFANEQSKQTSTDQDIVISASMVETKRVETGSSITVLDAQYIEENQDRSVAELLRDVPGVSVASNGGVGKKTSVFIRGASSESTVVVIDGVKMNNRSSSNGGYDFAHLMTDNIETIEVLRGPQSALWGSDAMGGVINITTKKGQPGFHPSASVEVGMRNYHKEHVNLSGGTEKSHYAFTATNIETDGISSKTGEFDDPDDDGYKNQNISFKAGHQFNNIFSIDGVGNYTDSESEYDVTGNYDDNYGKVRQRLAKLNGYMNLLDDQWKNRLSVSYSDSKSETFEPQGYYGPYSKNSGDNVKGELQSDYYITGDSDFEHRFTVAAETEESTFLSWGDDQEKSMNSSAVIGEYAIDWTKTVFLTTSVRRDFNSEFDDKSTHKLTLTGWATDGIRLHASQGTGVRNPTFYQLYNDPTQLELNPETSKSWDIGAEYNFESVDGYVDITYFDADYEDAIRWDPTIGSWGGYVNQDEKTSGIELSSFVRVNEKTRVNGQYTYLNTEDGTEAKNELLRRPKHSASANLNYKFTSKFSTNLGVRYVGERLDYGNINLDSYTLVNIAANYQVHKHIALNARVENVFDTDYEEITDYGTEPVTAYIGITVK